MSSKELKVELTFSLTGPVHFLIFPKNAFTQPSERDAFDIWTWYYIHLGEIHISTRAFQTTISLPAAALSTVKLERGWWAAPGGWNRYRPLTGGVVFHFTASDGRSGPYMGLKPQLYVLPLNIEFYSKKKINTFIFTSVQEAFWQQPKKVEKTHHSRVNQVRQLLSSQNTKKDAIRFGNEILARPQIFTKLCTEVTASSERSYRHHRRPLAPAGRPNISILIFYIYRKTETRCKEMYSFKMTLHPPPPSPIILNLSDRNLFNEKRLRRRPGWEDLHLLRAPSHIFNIPLMLF